MKTIPLSRELCALVDDDDYEWLSQNGLWSAAKRNQNGFYAVRNNPETGKQEYMHMIIMELHSLHGIPRGMVVDHGPDTNGLNNQKHNLTIVSSRENTRLHHARRRSQLFLKPIERS
jgi:hypothetical protein